MQDQCHVCGQVLPESGIGGEYPCRQCGVPTVHDDGLPNFEGCVRLLCAVARQWTREALINARHGSFWELHRLADWLGVDAVWLRRQLDDARLFSIMTR